ncbi:DNA-formamidopyrimidine glycosylase family protein [Streptomyces sp. NPDC055013]
MPELPDVEGFRNVLQSCAKGRTIRRVDVRDPGVLHGVSTRRLRHSREGRRVTGAVQHAKWLLARTGGPTLALHFGMTGPLLCAHPDDAAEPHDRVLLTVARDHRLRHRDQRGLQGLWPADDDSDGVRLLRDQGPDALTVDREEFGDVLASPRGRVKSVLIDQSALAGLGNLLADEILWRARLRPNIPANALAEPERHRLHTELRRTLRPAVTAGRVSPGPRPQSPACLATPGTLPHSRLRSSGRGSHRRTGRRPEYVQYEGLRPAGREHAPDAAGPALRANDGTSRTRPSPTWLTGRRDDPDPHCPRCGTPLRRTRVAGRTTVWCPGCRQKGA